MKKFTILILFLYPLFLIGQIDFDLTGLAKENISTEITKGSLVKLISITYEKYDKYKANILMNYKTERIKLEDLKKISFNVNNSKDFWINQALINGYYENIIAYGLQHEKRRELEGETLRVISELEKSDYIIEDAFLESYLYSLVYKINPPDFKSPSTRINKIIIYKDLSPNAVIYPNGTMLINTGLLSTINSEEELISIMAHEISHYILDHAVININKTEKRKESSDFWASFTTVLAAAIDVHMHSNNAKHPVGLLTASTAILAFNIASTVNERMGLKFSREQEMQADKCAVELMKFRNLDHTALASALNKIKNYAISTGDYISLSGEGSHPAIDDRIKEIGNPSTFNDDLYDKRMSVVHSFNAIQEFRRQHLSSCITLIDRNIEAKVATEVDYILKAKVLLYMYDNNQKNNEVLTLLNKAISLNVYPDIEMFKQKAIVLLRLKKMGEATNSLTNYLEGLKKHRSGLDRIKDTQYWLVLNNYLDKEFEWTTKMINKVSKL